jgi:hypothetical protein
MTAGGSAAPFENDPGHVVTDTDGRGEVLLSAVMA